MTAELSKDREKSISVFIGFLKKARLRWTLVILVSLIGLFAGLVSPSSNLASEDATAFLSHIEAIEQERLVREVRSQRFTTSLPADLIARIEGALETLSDASNKLDELGNTNTTLEFFTLGSEFSSLASAVKQLTTSPPPADILDWNSEVLSGLVSIFDTKSIVSGQSPLNQTIQVSNATILTKQSNALSELETILVFAETLGEEDKFKDVKRSLTVAAQSLKRDLDALGKVSPVISGSDATRLFELNQTLEKWHTTSVRSAYERSLALATAARLDSGSVSAAGITIPGVVINLLLPLLALGLAVDLMMILRRAIRWAARSMRTDDVRHHLRLFPWIPVLMLADAAANDRGGKALSVVAVLTHFLPPLALGYMVLTSADDLLVSIIAMLSVLGLAFVLLIAMRLLIHLPKIGLEEANFDQELPDPTIDLITIHLERIDVAWTTMMTVSGAVSVFFIAFLFVPAELLVDRSDITKAAETRAKLDAVYEQRLKEHRDTYLAWSKKVADQFHELTFLSAHLPENHAAYRLAEAMNEKPPLSSYPSAISNFDDVVEEERAALAELDLYDLNDLIEILYRNDMGDLSEAVNGIRDALAASPLSKDAMDALPAFVKPPKTTVVEGTVGKPIYGSVSNSKPVGIRVDVPLPYPYRVEVEKGGFAYHLQELPDREDVVHLTALMEKAGLAQVSAFDGYKEAYATFDKELGTLKLQIFGVEIDRRLANMASVIIVNVLLGLLLMRVVVANRVFASIEDAGGRSLLIASTSTSFMHGMNDNASIASVVTGLLVLVFPLCVIAIVVWSSWGGASDSSLLTIGLLLSAVLTAAIFSERHKLEKFQQNT